MEQGNLGDSALKPELPIENVKVIQTNQENITGQDKCPKCGATDISLNIGNGKLKCNYCRFEFEPVKVHNMVEDISSLNGQVQSSGSAQIDASFDDLVTLKCSSCGAEVVVDTSSSTQSRCHWCRNTLSINQQIPNGSVPDFLLPFKLEKNVAQNSIKAFVDKRKFYANNKFKEEFTTENIMGVYLPYLMVDINSHVNLVGDGEHLVRSYMVGNNEHKHMEYDADEYVVSREFDLTIKGLTIESSKDKLDNSSSSKTNNVINSILPFDTENCVAFNSNYLNGFTSEKRTLNIEGVKDIVYSQAKDIGRFAANDSLKFYDRGVHWKQEDFNVLGQQWKSAYFPVWLYSYQEDLGEKKVLHYVAVNARTNETMGSVPLNTSKLLFVSFLVELLGLLLVLFVDFDYSFLFLALGFIYYAIIYKSYRNQDKRHSHELETLRNVTNMNCVDNLTRRKKRLRNRNIDGMNNTAVHGSTVKKKGMF